MKEKNKEKATEMICEYCLKRSVCKYTEEFLKTTRQISETIELTKVALLEISCSQYVDYRRLTYRRG